MSQSQTTHCTAKYMCLDWGELIYGTRDDLQSFGIGIGLAFPGERNGPKRQLVVRDPRGFRVKITKSYGEVPTFAASISYPHLPDRPRYAESTPFSGVWMQEGPWTDDFTGNAECLIAAGLVTAEQLPGAPGMRKTRVTIFADGSILDGNYSNNIPGGLSAGVKHVERASSRSATFTVRIHIELGERAQRESRREIAESAWHHQVSKLPRPRKLTPCHVAAVARNVNAAAAARNDASFQALLGRLVQSSAGDAS